MPPKNVKKGESNLACKKKVPENSVIAVEAEVVVVVTVFFNVVVAALVVASIAVFAFCDNGTIVFEPNHTNKEEEKQ